MLEKIKDRHFYLMLQIASLTGGFTCGIAFEKWFHNKDKITSPCVINVQEKTPQSATQMHYYNNH